MSEARISLAQVEHVARLARLALSPEEKDRMRGQLDAILGYVEQLRRIDAHDQELRPLRGGAEVSGADRLAGLEQLLALEHFEDFELGFGLALAGAGHFGQDHGVHRFHVLPKRLRDSGTEGTGPRGYWNRRSHQSH